ncbi:MAG: HEAT repeat domain-containing protein [Planctomycetes bacterium]|nr:HEAT repeat domain-containing protein [Planctomycetota bacterium]
MVFHLRTTRATSKNSQRGISTDAGSRRASNRPLLCAVTLILAACSSTDPDNRGAGGGIKDPAIEQDAQRRLAERDEAISRNNDFSLALVRIDKALDEYTTNVSKSENIVAQRRADSLKTYLETQSRRFDRQLLEALGSDAARQRGIAAAALGFSGEDIAVEPLENALDDEEEFVRTNAALGLGQLASTATRIDGLVGRALDDKASALERRAAAWALYRIQNAMRPKGFVPLRDGKFSKVWPALLAGNTLDKDGILTVQALRGLGMLRDPSTLEDAARYLSHPQALIRQAALVAVARTRNRKGAPMILPFLSTTEQNPNVRLAARKALKALTGDRVDYEYDTKQWRKEFQDVIEASATSDGNATTDQK